MNYKAIIFDMDGTIVDTDFIWDQATKLLIESRGVAFTPELEAQLHVKIKGLATHLSCQLIKDITCIEDPVEELIREKSRIAQELYKDGISFIPGFVEFHKKVLLKNFKTGVATNADDVTLKTTDDVLQLRQFFGEHLYNISCVGNVCKPDPALYVHAAQKLGVEPKECVAIEDSPNGIRAAKRAGMTCIGINTGKNRAILHEADLIVEGYEEIDLGKF